MFAFLFLLALSACGKAPNTPLLSYYTEIWPADGSNINGVYVADFITLNTDINGFLTTSSYIQREDDDFKVYVKMNKAKYSWHRQGLFNGYRCPVPGDDSNGDGLIDAEEGKRVWGSMILPFDGNINTQSDGQTLYPLEDNYFYYESASFTKLFADLQDSDPDPTDDIDKIGENGFSVASKVVVIFGVDDYTELPATVRSINNLPAKHTFPIACGLYREVPTLPEEYRNRRSSTTLGRAHTPHVPTPRPTPTPSPTPEPEEEEEDRPWWDWIWP